MKPTGSVLLTNAKLVEPEARRVQPGQRVFVRDGLIAGMGADCPDTAQRVVDLGGRALMPGLIDCHVHATAVESTFSGASALPASLLAFRTAHVLDAMLQRGFTTVRDMGGADHGLVRAVDEGWIPGPRIVTCGRVLSQTGGHGDFRGRYDTRYRPICCTGFGIVARLCDGVSEVRKACREELKGGADFIKLMANGGCTSPTDPIEGLQFSEEEIRAAVEEAAMAKTYVAAHLYTDESIARAVALGIRSVEHCNLVQPETARLMKRAGAFACPTLVTHRAVLEQAGELGLSADSVRKTRMVAEGGPHALRILSDAGVPIAFGSDLLGAMHARQSEQFDILADVLEPEQVIDAATTTAARLLRMEGRIGCIRPGAFADLIVVDGDPMADPRLLADPSANLSLIMKNGDIVKNTL